MISLRFEVTSEPSPRRAALIDAQKNALFPAAPWRCPGLSLLFFCKCLGGQLIRESCDHRPVLVSEPYSEHGPVLCNNVSAHDIHLNRCLHRYYAQSADKATSSPNCQYQIAGRDLSIYTYSTLGSVALLSEKCGACKATGVRLRHRCQRNGLPPSLRRHLLLDPLDGARADTQLPHHLQQIGFSASHERNGHASNMAFRRF
jgi:hypothetical protein